MMAEGLGCLPPTWGTWLEPLTPGSGQTQPGYSDIRAMNQQMG